MSLVWFICFTSEHVNLIIVFFFLSFSDTGSWMLLFSCCWNSKLVVVKNVLTSLIILFILCPFTCQSSCSAVLAALNVFDLTRAPNPVPNLSSCLVTFAFVCSAFHLTMHVWCLSRGPPLDVRVMAQQLMLQTHFFEQYGKSNPSFIDSLSFLSLNLFCLYRSYCLTRSLFLYPSFYFSFTGTQPLLCPQTQEMVLLSTTFSPAEQCVSLWCCWSLGSVFTTFCKICPIYLKIQVLKKYYDFLICNFSANFWVFYWIC